MIKKLSEELDFSWRKCVKKWNDNKSIEFYNYGIKNMEACIDEMKNTSTKITGLSEQVLIDLEKYK